MNVVQAKKADFNIGELRGGASVKEVNAAILTAVERVKATRKKAKIVITLTIDPADPDDQDVNTVWVNDKVKTVLPDLPQKNTLLFVDPETNQLSRTNPQLSIEREA